MRQACAPRPRRSQAAATASPSTFPSNTTPLGGSVPERVWVILSLLSLQGNETHHSAPSPSFFHPGMHPNGLFLCSETINTHGLSRQFSSATEAKPLVNKYNIVFYKSKKKTQRRRLATREASLWQGRRKPGPSVSGAPLPEASLSARAWAPASKGPSQQALEGHFQFQVKKGDGAEVRVLPERPSPLLPPCFSRRHWVTLQQLPPSLGPGTG